MRCGGSGSPASGSWQDHLRASIQFETLPSTSWRLHIATVATQIPAPSSTLKRDAFARRKVQRGRTGNCHVGPLVRNEEQFFGELDITTA